jgi:toxin ParE1/3/4
MAKLAISFSAQADAVRIARYLAANAGQAVANKYVAAFDHLYMRFADHPESGAPRPSLGRYVRIGIVLPYIVIYEYYKTDDVVMIMRVIHGQRKITRRMLK